MGPSRQGALGGRSLVLLDIWWTSSSYLEGRYDALRGARMISVRRMGLGIDCLASILV